MTSMFNAMCEFLRSKFKKNQHASLADGSVNPDDIGKMDCMRLCNGAVMEGVGTREAIKMSASGKQGMIATSNFLREGFYHKLGPSSFPYMHGTYTKLMDAMQPFLSPTTTRVLESLANGHGDDTSYSTPVFPAFMALCDFNRKTTAKSEDAVISKYDVQSIPFGPEGETHTSSTFVASIANHKRSQWFDMPEELMVAISERAATLVPGWEAIAVALETMKTQRSTDTDSGLNAVTGAQLITALSRGLKTIDESSHDPEAPALPTDDSGDTALLDFESLSAALEDGTFVLRGTMRTRVPCEDDLNMLLLL